jgi:hypothetical protein
MPDGTVAPDVTAAIRSAPGGASLGGATRRWATEAFGPAVAGVRVHTDSAAHALARAVSARAFTVRSSVFFARGQYRPDTAPGRRLLAHELAHVVQQHGAPSTGPLRVTAPGDAHERAADRAADVAGA